jgi:hypothetical protein
VVASEEAQPASVGKDILERVTSGPNKTACAMCKGLGCYGIPGRRCTFCDGTGWVKWRSRRVEDQPLNTTPVVDQKAANLNDNTAGVLVVDHETFSHDAPTGPENADPT